MEFWRKISCGVPSGKKNTTKMMKIEDTKSELSKNKSFELSQKDLKALTTANNGVANATKKNHVNQMKKQLFALGIKNFLVLAGHEKHDSCCGARKYLLKSSGNWENSMENGNISLTSAHCTPSSFHNVLSFTERGFRLSHYRRWFSNKSSVSRRLSSQFPLKVRSDKT